MNIFSSIKRISTERGNQRLQSYRELVADVAAGRDVDPSQAVDVLESAGKTDDDLRRDTETFRHMDALRPKAAELNDLEAEYKRVGQELLKAGQERDAAIAAAKQRYSEIETELRRLTSRIHAAKDAQRELNSLSLKFNRENPVDQADDE